MYACRWPQKESVLCQRAPAKSWNLHDLSSAAGGAEETCVAVRMQSEREWKRSRGEAAESESVCSPKVPTPEVQPPLLALPEDVIFQFLSWLDSRSLVALQAMCRAFKGHLSRRTGDQMTLLEKAARESLLRKHNTKPTEAYRWGQYGWLQRLRIEETESAFDVERCERSGFHFFSGPDNRIEKLKLEGIGPRMLVSKDTTKTVDFLHWRLEVRGNNAVELGVVPEALQDSPKALHKCQVGPNNERPTGIFSSITVGSLLPVRVPLMKGSDVEVLAWPHKLEFLITQPAAGYEMTWINSTTVPRPYTGPKQLKLEINLDLHGPAKLALTCWAHAEFSLPNSGAPRDTNVFPGMDMIAAAVALDAAAVAADGVVGLVPGAPEQPAVQEPQPEQLQPVQQQPVQAQQSEASVTQVQAQESPAQQQQSPPQQSDGLQSQLQSHQPQLQQIQIQIQPTSGDVSSTMQQEAQQQLQMLEQQQAQQEQ